MSFSASTDYVSYAYSTPSTHSQGHIHVVTPSNRAAENAQRKRPKYTRSKTGCMTCRGKKIKCDETKPNCLRCTHGQRECTWPEGVPTRKRSGSKKTRDSVELTRPSTAGSSEHSNPPTRDGTPKREAIEPSMPSHNIYRRSTEPSIHLPSVNNGVLSPERRPNAPVVTNFAYSQDLPNLAISDRSYSSYPQGNTYYDPRATRHLPDPRHQFQIPNSIPGHLDPIEPFFPTVQERNLIRHYCDHSLSFIMAVPSENPIVAANLPLILSRAPGSDSAIEALRLSLLGVAAVHQSFLLSRSGHTSNGAAEIMALANDFRLNSKQYLAKACTIASGAQSDAALGASLAISLTDIFAGGHNWQKNMELAKILVKIRGGPGVLLARSLEDKLPAGSGVFRAKLMLEILAVYDIFACLSTGDEPSLLAPNASTWWMDGGEPTLNQSYVENVFGISRAFVPLFARAVSFLSRTARSRISEVNENGLDVINPEATSESNEIYTLLEQWGNSINHTPPRIRAGNSIYKAALQLALLREVHRVPPTDPTIQQSTREILNTCAECSTGQMGVDLIWPVIIAGSQAYGSDRTLVMEIFNSFRGQCCYEVDTAEQIVAQVWKRLDEDYPNADWRSVIEDFSLRVLLL